MPFLASMLTAASWLGVWIDADLRRLGSATGFDVELGREQIERRDHATARL